MSLLDTASLIVTPNAYAESKLYSVIPSDGSGDLSVTRATTATRVNSAGLVELVPYNLAQYSEQFDNAAWTKFGSTSATANTAISPSGLQDADTITTSGLEVIRQSVSLTANSVNTYSVYVKKISYDYFGFQTLISGSGSKSVFNLSNGTIQSQGSGHTASIEDAGNGWYRCIVTFNCGSSSSNIFDFTTDTSISTLQSFYAWGAQAVEGSTAKDYQKTETRLNIPRLDYSNGTCPSLLVEPQRTNFLTYSNDYSDSSWGKAGVTATLGTQINPQGIASTYSIANTTLGDSYLQKQGLPTTAGTYTMSVFLKNIDNVSTTQLMAVHLFEGSITSQLTYTWSTNTFAISGTNAIAGNVTPYENGWIRISFTYSIGALTTLHFSRLYANNDLSVTKSALVYGFQTEQGSYATSYIPTTSASVTRNADVISKTGISSLIGQTEGTLFVDLYRENLNEIFFIILSDIAGTLANSYVNSFYLFQLSNGLFAADGFVSNVQQFKVEKLDGLSVGRHKIAMAYKQNDFALYIDGVLIGTDTSGNIPALNCLTIGGSGDVSSAKNIINATALWKTRLTNTQLAQLTSI